MSQRYNIITAFRYLKADGCSYARLYGCILTNNAFEELKKDVVKFIFKTCPEWLMDCIKLNFAVKFYPQVIVTSEDLDKIIHTNKISENTVFITAEKNFDVPATSDDDRCVVCMQRRKIMMFQSCSHLCICQECSIVVLSCPLCQKSSKKQRVYY
jgi:hypothetical protein